MLERRVPLPRHTTGPCPDIRVQGLAGFCRHVTPWGRRPQESDRESNDEMSAHISELNVYMLYA